MLRWLGVAVISLLVADLHAQQPLRIGLWSEAAPFVQQNLPQGVLADGVENLFYRSLPPPIIMPFDSANSALKALQTQRIDLLIAAKAPGENLIASDPLLAFPLAALHLANGQRATLCFPELPADALRKCQKIGSPVIDENIDRLINREANTLIAPAFLLESYLTHTPATTLSLQALPNVSPLHYYAWGLPTQAALIEQINQRIMALNPQNARWLEQKWQLPSGSVFNARLPPASELTSRQVLHIELPVAAPPLVQIEQDGQIHGIWYDLLSHLFPTSRLRLVFTLQKESPDPGSQPAPHALVRIVASQKPPRPDAILFDSLNWGIISLTSAPLSGRLNTLRHMRLGVRRHSAFADELAHWLPAENIVLLDSLSEGVDLLKGGGINGLVGDAFTLNYTLKNQHDKSLQLTPLALAKIPLWFVPEIDDPRVAEEVLPVLASVTAGDIYTSRFGPLATINESNSEKSGIMWLLVMIVITCSATLCAIALFSFAQFKERRHQREMAQRQDELALWKALMSSAPVSLFACDPLGRLICCNEAFAQAPFMPPGIVAGINISTLPLGELASQVMLPHRLTLLNSSAPVAGESVLLHGETTIYWWLCRYTDTPGHARGMVGGWVDISEKAALTLALNHALTRAEQASVEKSNFLARMSHDIRTPLNAVLGLLELEQDKNHSLTVAWQAAGTLRDLIGDILDLSHIESGELILDRAPHNLYQLLHASADVFASGAREKGLLWYSQIDLPADGFFLCDKSRVNQIVANLLSNAVKYTLNGEISFSARYAEEQLHFTISDSGIGIPDEAIPYIGQPWFQTDRATPQSSGLGLAICYQLVELMAGTLHIASTPGRGTIISVTLPLKPAADGPQTDTAPQGYLAAMQPRRRVLIVDDFAANLTVMARQLERLDQQVICCSNAADALRILAEEQIDILITDSQMPEINGYQLVRTLLLDDMLGKAYAPALILGCTASALQEEEDRARHAGMDMLLRKPLAADRLHQALMEYREASLADISELRALADRQPAILRTLLQQIHEAIGADICALHTAARDPDLLSQIAHRLKGSWDLLGIRRAFRCCLVVEALPEYMTNQLLDEADLPQLIHHFIAVMQDSLTELNQQIIYSK